MVPVNLQKTITDMSVTPQLSAATGALVGRGGVHARMVCPRRRWPTAPAREGPSRRVSGASGNGAPGVCFAEGAYLGRLPRGVPDVKGAMQVEVALTPGSSMPASYATWASPSGDGSREGDLSCRGDRRATSPPIGLCMSAAPRSIFLCLHRTWDRTLVGGWAAAVFVDGPCLPSGSSLSDGPRDEIGSHIERALAFWVTALAQVFPPPEESHWCADRPEWDPESRRVTPRRARGNPATRWPLTCSMSKACCD